MCHLIHNVVDCEWNDWKVGDCTKSCGEGTRNYTRTEKVSAAYGGKKCDGPALMEKFCNIQDCPGHTKNYFFERKTAMLINT